LIKRVDIDPGRVIQRSLEFHSNKIGKFNIVDCAKNDLSNLSQVFSRKVILDKANIVSKILIMCGHISIINKVNARLVWSFFSISSQYLIYLWDSKFRIDVWSIENWSITGNSSIANWLYLTFTSTNLYVVCRNVLRKSLSANGDQFTSSKRRVNCGWFVCGNWNLYINQFCAGCVTLGGIIIY